MTSKKKPGSRRERTIHEVRGTISDMLKGGKTNSGFADLDDEMDSLDRAAKQASNMIDHKVASAYKIKKMEQAGIFSRKDIDQAKKDLGISIDGEEASTTQEGSYNILSTQIANEQDPDERRRLSHEMMIVDVYKQLKGRPMHEIQTAVNNLKMSFIEPKKTESKTEDFKDKLLLKFIDKNMGEPKSELDNLDKLTTLIEKVQKLTPQGEGLKDIAANVKAYKEMGFIKDSATTIEESKLKVEELKINKEYEIKKEEISNDSVRTKALTEMGGDVLGSVFEAIGAATSKSDGKTARTNPAVRQETLQNAMNATCVTPQCGAKILVTNVDQSREIKCGNCGQKYVFDADQKKLFVAGVEQSGPETPGPAPASSDQDTSQSSTA